MKEYNKIHYGDDFYAGLGLGIILGILLITFV